MLIILARSILIYTVHLSVCQKSFQNFSNSSFLLVTNSTKLKVKLGYNKVKNKNTYFRKIILLLHVILKQNYKNLKNKVIV